jgi:hypothetical protein
MALAERRSIEELVNLYRLEPTLRDIFVEGSSDRLLAEWFLQENNARAATVKEVDFIEIPANLVAAAGLENNNRGRLVALARELERELGTEGVSVTCLVDSDFDRVLAYANECTLVLRTDFTSVEMYFYEPRCIHKFLQLVVHGFPKSAVRVLAELQEVLQDLFLIRIASHMLGWGLGLTQFEKLCTLTDAGIDFDRAEYTRRVLVANQRAAQLEQFTFQIEACRQLLTPDRRNQMHGHDFVALLAWYVRSHGKRRVSREIIERSLPACTESAWLSDHEMFKELLRRATA